MGRFYLGAVLLVCTLTACLQGQFTHCPDVDCPAKEVCDGQGGCALPDQLIDCMAKADGDSCSYTDLTGKAIDGACNHAVCIPVGCGNGLVTAPEVCDDGNTTNGDGCSADCLSNETCGNGTVDPAKGEQCDDGNTTDGDGCQHDCKFPRCGDGVKDVGLSEECDAGSANSNAPDAACRTNCQLPRCGDGVVDPAAGEVCDDGNNQSADGCSGDCRSNETCGNGVVDVLAGEACDDGNTVSGDGCSSDCKSTEVCGNHVIDIGRGEVCDDGNTVSGDGCSSDCKSLEVCGNAIVDTIDEQCDLGSANSNAPDSQCRTNCKFPACGDAIVDPMHGEQCDNGAQNSNTADKCRTTCQLPRCGDAIKDTGEVCDDGNAISGDGCSADCKSNETCGNGIVDIIDGEQCDAGGLNSLLPNAPCRPTCVLPKCGDTIIDTAFGESCDAGAANSNSPNAACRTNCQPARCGDHILDTAMGEVCDDGNVASGDGCSADCKSLEVCGNGIVDVAKGEQCDDGNAVNNDQCHNNCTLPRCGDGIVDFNEQCDAGSQNSNAPNAPCRPTCVLPRCGDGIVDTARGEVCDDGNVVFGDGCRPDCLSNETCGNGIVDIEMNEQCDDGNTRGRDGCSACKQEAAIVLTPGQTPNKRDSHTIAYDGARQRIVMYGGWTVDGNLADTWEWDGTSWTQITTAHSPGPRLDASMAYDAVRHRVVLFGGYSANYTGYKGDTWEYDGFDWKLMSPTASPPATAAASMSFDGKRGHLLLYGGLSNDTTQPTATWDYDGSTWTKLAPATNPGSRSGARMAYDAKYNDVMLVGGGDNHVWTWDGAAWTDKGAQTALASTGYDSVALAFDAKRQAMIAWDGNLTNTFEWSGSTWTAVAGTPTVPTTTPASRYSYIEFAYDAARKQVLLFGGYGLITGTSPNTTTDDYNVTWLRSGTAWAQPAAFAEPPVRFRSAEAYDPIRKRVVLFGGQTDVNHTSVSDTWEWDGSKWALVNTTASPPVRAGITLDYDTKTRSVMMFGGDSQVAGTTNVYADLWSYNGTTWTQPPSSTGRSGLRNSGMAYDVTADRVVTFAGRDDDPTTGTFNPLDTTWYYDATGWHQAAPVAKPPARKNFAIAYDPVRNRTVVFGGQDGSGNLVSDVWEWNETTWTQISPLAGPDPRIGSWMVYNADVARVLVFGNSGNLSGEDLWEWNGAAWTQRQVVGSIAPRYREGVAYDTAQHALVVFSGREGSTPTGNTQLLAYWPNQTVEACTSAQIDYDNDGKAGCADEDCWSVCTPLCTPGAACGATAPRCGDGTCSANEDCNLCPQDCGACTGGTCGDFHCDSATESHATCPNDC